MGIVNHQSSINYFSGPAKKKNLAFKQDRHFQNRNMCLAFSSLRYFLNSKSGWVADSKSAIPMAPFFPGCGELSEDNSHRVHGARPGRQQSLKAIQFSKLCHDLGQPRNDVRCANVVPFCHDAADVSSR